MRKYFTSTWLILVEVFLSYIAHWFQISHSVITCESCHEQVKNSCKESTDSSRQYSVMSSGFGLNGTVSRCYYHFEDFARCMVRRYKIGQRLESLEISNRLLKIRSIFIEKNLKTSQKVEKEPLKSCHSLRDDYLECLHHKKEVSGIFDLWFKIRCEVSLTWRFLDTLKIK